MSTVTISSDKLFYWCQEIQKEILEEREARKNKALDQEIARVSKSNWLKKSEEITREQAYDNLIAAQNATLFHDGPLFWAKRYASDQFDIASRLMAGALVASQVTVDTTDVEPLVKWSQKLAESVFKSNTHPYH